MNKTAHIFQRCPKMYYFVGKRFLIGHNSGDGNMSDSGQAILDPSCGNPNIPS